MTGRIKKRSWSANSPPKGMWVAISQDMMESAAWRGLSHAGMLVLWRVIVEHMSHGLKDNGRLPVTYDDFQAYGVRRNSICAAIAETAALGFIERTEKGRRAFGDAPGRASRYRLTFLGVIRPDGTSEPTNEWLLIRDGEMAAASVAKALAGIQRVRRPRRAKEAMPTENIDSSSGFDTGAGVAVSLLGKR